MKRPVIGITSSISEMKGRRNAYEITSGMDYSLAVLNAGGIPFILPIHNNKDVLADQIKHLDGLLLSGGIDVDPIYYGEECIEGMGGVSPERDEFELFLLSEFLKTKKPILGICRGMQLVNVFYGGSLYQDVSHIEREIKIQHAQKYLPELPVHNINIEKGNLLYDIFGETARINSFHHQMLKDLGENLTVIATASDGVIEAVQDKGHPFFYNVQWHPEMMATRENQKMKKIFEEFIKACVK